MFKKYKRNLTLRKAFIESILLLISISLIITLIYYNTYFNRNLQSNYNNVHEALSLNIKEIKNNINDNNINKYLNSYSNSNKIFISIKDIDNNYIYNNVKTNDLLDEENELININNNIYQISVYKSREDSISKQAHTFVIFEIVLITILTLLGILSANIKLLEPITSFSKDMMNYKHGIKPKKRKNDSLVDSLQNDFVDLVDSLEEEKKIQNRIIASISHDIKTPLTSILGYSELLSKSDSNNNYIKKIYNKSLVMKDIMEEFDNYLSINIDEDKKEKISIGYLIDYLNDYYKDDLKEKDIDLKIRTNCKNLYIFVDYKKLKRVFANIITNSIRYLNKNKKLIIININTKKDSIIEFEIADNGIGTKEDLNKIFEPLYTTDPSRKISGLGLSICKEIIESHDGKIKAINNKYRGLSIIFTLKEYKES